MTAPAWLPESDLQAYLDGELVPERLAEVEAYLASHPDDVERLARYRAQGDLIRRLYAPLLRRPLPDDLLTPLLAAGAGRARRGFGHRIAALAAALAMLLAVGAAGWFARDYLEPGVPATARFVADALDAHRVYSVEVRHPVEVPATEADHLVTWLSRRLGLPVAAPDLSAHGFELVGGRLLPADVGPAAQLMYQDAGGRRVTLYVRPSPEPRETAFRFESEGPLSALHWRDGGAAWALLGELPRAELMPLAHTVYQALHA